MKQNYFFKAIIICLLSIIGFVGHALNNKEITSPSISANKLEGSSTVNPIPGFEEPFYSGGTGTESDPFKISTWEHLQNISQNLANDSYFVLINDLDSETPGYDTYASANANAGAGWLVLGSDPNHFSGNFDGQYHIISDLVINRPTMNEIGLFSTLGDNAQISNLGLVDVSIKGRNTVGGLVGSNEGADISNAFVTGTVSGETGVGGLIAYSIGNSIIKNSYTNVEVSGNNVIGGLIGFNTNGTASINSCYSSGLITGSMNVGGFIGLNNSSGETINSFWDVETSGKSTSAGGTGLTTAQMKTLATFTDATWDFTADTGVWNIKQVGTGEEFSSYPFLQGFAYDIPEANPEVNPIPGLEFLYAGGSGTSIDPYQISDWKHLHNVRENMSSFFILNNNLDESSPGYDTYASSTANDNEGWLPIGVLMRFYGHFNGNYHTIKGLTINRGSTDYIGFFGMCGPGSDFKNVGILDVSIIGGSRVGGLSGSMSGRSDNISNVFVTGTVTGVSEVGGLIGRSAGMNISLSYTDVAVEATDLTAPYAGGFIGNSAKNLASMCYAVGAVKSLVASTTGGFIGSGSNNVTKSYWDMETSGQTTSSGGGIGKSTAEMKTQATFTDWNFTANTGVWNIKQSGTDAGLFSYPYLQAFTYDSPNVTPSVNPIPGLEGILPPVVTDTNINISGATGTGSAFKISDTVTASWDNTTEGDNNSSLISGVTVNFSQFGGGAAVVATNSSGTWTATYTIPAGVIDAANRNISVTATDNAGNSTTTADTTNATVDNIAPMVSNASIGISGGTGTGGAFKTGDTVTASWDNSAFGDDNSDAIGGVTVDFSMFGGGTTVVATNSIGTWTATYTLTAGAVDGSNRNISVTATDNAGNSTTTADTTNATVDNIAPMVSNASISISGATGTGGAFKIGDTVTATWDNSAIGDDNSDVISGVTVDFSEFGGGAAVVATNSSGTWTATYTITAGGIDAANKNISVTATDNAGNATTTIDTTNATVDSIAPVVSNASISISGATGTGGAFKIGDTVTATWDNSAIGDDNSDVISGVTVNFSEFGGGAAVVATNSSGTWTATYTIPAGVVDAANRNLSVTATDNAGNSTTTADTTNATVDSIAPVVSNASISISGATGTGGAFKIGDTVTASWDNSAFGDDNSDAIGGVTVDFSMFGGGATVVATNSIGTWTATFTLTAGVVDAANRNISVTATDNAGNSTTTADTTNATVDNIAPMVSNASISISGATGTGGAFKIGDTVTASWDNSAFGDDNSDAISGVTVDFSMFGGGAAVVATNSSGTWTATYTITAGAVDSANRNISVTATDNAGNTTTTADTTNATVDTQRPTATVVVSDTQLTVGETNLVTITFSEAITGLTLTDFTVANGILSGLSSSDGGVTWTVTFTPTNGTKDATNVISLDNTGYSDLGGNAGSGTSDSNNFTIDTQRPTATVVVSDTQLTVGETSLVTITFSEAITGLTLTDFTVANGILSGLSSSDGGITWTATFTPTNDIKDATNVITLDNTGYSDLGGNAGSGTTDSNNYAIDTQRPTATVVVSDTQLRVGETSLVTITFSEAVSGLTLADFSAANGNLSGLSSSDGGITWTATLTPGAGVEDTTNVVTLDNTGYSDLGGNAGSGTTDSNNYAIDTQRPTATVVVSDTQLTVGETSLVTIIFSEAITGLTLTDFTVANGILSGLSSSDGGITWTATLTPSAGVEDTTNVVTLDNTGFADQAGNTGSEITNSNNYAVDTISPAGYSIEIDQAIINGVNENAVSFTFAGAEVGTNYTYSFSSSAGVGTVEASGTISSESQQISAIDLSSLPDGVITLLVTLSDPAGNEGDEVSDTVEKLLPAVITITANIEAAEDDSDGEFTIETNNLFATNTTVVIEVGGTATNGTDYSTIESFFVFPANTSSVTIPVSVIADINVESDETVIVSLISTDNSLVTVGPRDEATITLTDNDVQRQLTITPEPNQQRVYGASDPITFNYTASGFDSGDDSSIIQGSLTREHGEDVDMYSFTLGNLDAGPNYELVLNSEVFTITRATLSIEVDELQKIYGAENPDYTYTASGFRRSDTAAILSGTLGRPVGENVGMYEFNLGTLQAGNNYNLKLISNPFRITSAPVNITADDKSKSFGQANPTLTFTYTGLVNGDLQVATEPSISTTANESSNAGTYPIELEGGSDPNYAITLLEGTLAIGKKAVTITADNESKVYGEANPILTFTYTGLVNGDTQVASEPSISTTATAGSNAGTYPVELDGGSDVNYAITLVDGTLTIGQKAVIISADEKSRVYGEANPTLTFIYTGLVNSDAQVATEPGISTTATANSDVGTYPITLSGGSDNNYTIKLVNGTLTIIQANIEEITLKDGSFVYDGSVQSLAIIGELPEGTSVVYSNNSRTDVGNQEVTATITGDNYTTLELTATLAITPATITGIIFENGSFVYDGSARSLVISGELSEGGTVEYVNNEKINAGTYTVTATVSQENYNDQVLTADLIIKKAEAIITAEATQTLTYDGTVKNVAAKLNHSETELVYAPQQGNTNAGTYPVAISAVETGNYLPASKEVSLVIENAEITGVAFEAATENFTYDGTEHSISVSGLPDGATVKYKNNVKINAGTYTVTATVSQDNFNDKVLTAELIIDKAEAQITAEATQTFTYDGTVKNVAATLNHSETTLTYAPAQGYTDAGTYDVTISAEGTDNYLPASEKVTLVIEKAEITGVTFEAATENFTYDGTEHSISVSGLPDGATVTYLNNGQINAGTYTVTATVSQENFNDKVLTAELIIDKAEALITAKATQTFTYDGTVKNVAATLNHSETALTYAPQQGYTDAGTYNVTISAEGTDNYLPASEEVSLVIEKAEITGVTFETPAENFTYDGTEHSISVSGLPQGATVTYSNNGQINAGTYTVTATVSQDNFNDKVLTAELIIDKAEAKITAEATQKFTYDGTVKNVAATLNHSETELTYAPAQGYTDAGTYNVTISAEGTDNYLPASEKVSLVIEKAEITGVTFKAPAENFTYDGTEHSISVSGLPNGATVTYSNNGQINAGTYTVTATVSQDNFNDKVLTAELIINKAEAKITAEATQTFTYDGTVKNVAATLNHSETALTYAPAQGYTDAGTYNVTISAEGTDNYLPASEKVSLVIEKAEITGVTFKAPAENFTYDGTEHSISVSGLPNGATVTYSNNGQINAGTYTVTATVSQDNFNDKVLTAELIINKAEAKITAEATQTFTYDGTVKNVAATPNHSETALTYAPAQGYTNAGTYAVTVASAETDNYLSASKEVSLVIENAEITGLAFEGETFIYDGTSHSIAVTGLPEGATVKYENNDKIDSGTYTVTATVSQDNFNDQVLTADLIINKAEAIITAEATQTSTYDGTVKNVAASLNHSETALTYTPAQGYTNAGTYAVTVASAETGNYLSASKEVSLVIENAEITGVNFKAPAENFTYDGTEHSISVTGLPEGATVTYSNNGQINAGTYTVTATVSQENYDDRVLTAVLVIGKAAQEITFAALSEKTLGDADFQLAATASSGLPVSYTYSYEGDEAPVEISENGWVSLLASGEVEITAHQEGNQNYLSAETLVQPLVITSNIAAIERLVIDGVVYDDPEEEIYYLIECAESVNSVDITLTPVNDASVSTGNVFRIETPKAGIYRQEVLVTSQDGSNTTTYTIVVEKRFSFEAIVVQKFDNVLLVNNNPQTNGGYEFVAFEWFLNGRKVGSGSYYSAGDDASDRLSPAGEYQLKVTTSEGEVLQTCPISISLTSYKAEIYPNPVQAGATITVEADFPQGELKNMMIHVYTLSGNLVTSQSSSEKRTQIRLPGSVQNGTYLIILKTPNIERSFKLIAK